MPAILKKCEACQHLGKCGRDLEKCDTFQKSVPPPQQAFMIATWARRSRYPGQVPGHRVLQDMRDAREVERMASEPPKTMIEALQANTAPVLTPAKIVDNLGLPIQQQLQWAQFLRDAANGAPNEITFRQTLIERFRNERLDPDLRNAIFQRSMSYARHVRKSMLEVFTPDELRKAAVTPVGGTTPGGYKKVAEGQYVKEKPAGASRQMALFGDEARPKPVVAAPEPPKAPSAPPAPPKPDFSAAQEYVAQISSPAKKKYATQYLKWMEGGEEGVSPEYGKLHPDVARTVRAMLRQSDLGKSMRFVIYPDRLQKCGKCDGPKFVMKKPIRRMDVLRKPEGGLAEIAEDDEDVMERCLKAGVRKRGRS